MSNFNNKWISVSHIDGNGYSHIQLQDIDRISITRHKSGDNEIHKVSVFVNGNEYMYTTKSTIGEAENSSLEVLRLIESAHGRLATPSAA